VCERARVCVCACACNSVCVCACKSVFMSVCEVECDIMHKVLKSLWSSGEKVSN